MKYLEKILNRSQSLINQGYILTDEDAERSEVEQQVAIPYKSGIYSYRNCSSNSQILAQAVAIPYKSGIYSYYRSIQIDSRIQSVRSRNPL